MTKFDKVYIQHMLDCVDRIDNYAEGMDLSAFLENPLVQDAVIRNLEIIGEAAKKTIYRFPL